VKLRADVGVGQKPNMQKLTLLFQIALLKIKMGVVICAGLST
jgi:hypothetical protein